MLVIRLTRTGRKKRPHYRVVVAEKSAAVKGKFLEVLGHYDPRTKELVIDNDRAKARLEAGAQPSETAEALLEKAGILKRDPITEQTRRPTRKPRKEEEAADKPAAPAAAEGEEAAPAEGEADATNEAPADEAKEADQSADEKPADETKDDQPAEEAKPEEPAAEDQKPDTNESADPEAPADNKGE